MPRSLGVRQLPSRRCGCERCRAAYPEPERKPTKNCAGSWQARWYDETGKRDSATRKRKEDALAARNAAIAAIDAGTYQDPKRGLVKLAEWREIWLKGRRVENTTIERELSHWRAHVGPRWGAKPLRAIRHQDVQNWVVEMEAAGLSKSSIRTILSSLGTLLDAARRDQRIEVNPCNDVVVRTSKGTTRRAPKPPTMEQVLEISAHMRPKRRRPDVYSRIPLMILETGLRWGELIGVLPDCVDLDEGEIEVRRVVEQVGSVRRLREYPKSDAGKRHIPLTRAARTLLLEHAELQPLTDGVPIFHSPGGTLLNRSNFHDRIWLPATIAAGVHTAWERPSGQLEHWPTPHDIRHSYASRLENAGVPDSVRKEVLGHERPKGDVTWNYTHAPVEYRAMLLAALGDEPDGPVTPVVRPLRLVS